MSVSIPLTALDYSMQVSCYSDPLVSFEIKTSEFEYEFKIECDIQFEFELEFKSETGFEIEFKIEFKFGSEF